MSELLRQLGGRCEFAPREGLTCHKEPAGPRTYPLLVFVVTPTVLGRHRRALLRPHRVRTARAALRFVNALGFCYAFTSGPGGLPGLFDVLATRSIDRMWSWAWQWKDELATARRLHYGKAIRRKPSYISLTMLPAFYALSGNVGEPDDYLQAYREGRLSAMAKALYEVILADGPVAFLEAAHERNPADPTGRRNLGVLLESRKEDSRAASLLGPLLEWPGLDLDAAPPVRAARGERGAVPPGAGRPAGTLPGGESGRGSRMAQRVHLGCLPPVDAGCRAGGRETHE